MTSAFPDMLTRDLPRTIRQRLRTAAYLRKWVVLGALIGLIAGVGAAVFFVGLELATKLFLGSLAGYYPINYVLGNYTHLIYMFPLLPFDKCTWRGIGTTGVSFSEVFINGMLGDRYKKW